MSTAALLVIGDEILSGRTQDKNIATLAQFCDAKGIDLVEVRVVRDDEAAIIAALNSLRASVDRLFTTGGIGPTHDDITADSVAKAFGVGIDVRDEAVAMMKARYPELEMNTARLRMARIPEGASLIPNSQSGAPGFIVQNVYVMAGVPRIMQAMLEALSADIPDGAPVFKRTINANGLKEGDYAQDLRQLAKDHPDVTIGSYPHMTDTGTVNVLVVRGRCEQKVLAADNAVKAMLHLLQPSEKDMRP